MKHIRYNRWVLGEFLLSQEYRIWLRLTLKPPAVLATLVVFLCLSVWFDNRIVNYVVYA